MDNGLCENGNMSTQSKRWKDRHYTNFKYYFPYLHSEGPKQMQQKAFVRDQLQQCYDETHASTHFAAQLNLASQEMETVEQALQR